MFFYSEKNINFLSHWGSFGEIKYDLETEEWIELSSTFLNEKPYLPLTTSWTKTTSWNKKTKFACIEKPASQLFCTGDIENINQAIDIYKKYDKKIPLDWPICAWTDVLKTLPKLKANLEKLEKYLLSTEEKRYSRRGKQKTLIENTKRRASIFTVNKKILDKKKKCCRKAKKDFFDEFFFFFLDVKIFFGEKIVFLSKKFPNKKKIPSKTFLPTKQIILV